MALKRLQDLHIFAPLAEAGKRAGVEVTLFGSVVSRAQLFHAAGVEISDMFMLAEHLSDVNIGHDGPAEATPELEAAIFDLMPLAPWFRWSIIDREGLRRHHWLARNDIEIPLRRLALGTRANGDDSAIDLLLKRALDGSLDVYHSETFSRSTRAKFESQVSAAMLYIDALHDILEAQHRSGRALVVSKSDDYDSLIEEGIARLARMSDGGLHREIDKIWHRFCAFALRISPDLFARAIDYFRLDSIVSYFEQFGYPVYSILEPVMERQAIIVAKQVGDHHARAPRFAFDAGFGNFDDHMTQRLALLGDWLVYDLGAPLRLAQGHKILASVPGIPLVPYQGDENSALSSLRDFLHISLGIPADMAPLDAEHLTAIVIGHDNKGSWLVPAYAAVSTTLITDRGDFDTDGSARCTIRLNLAGADFKKIDVYLVQGEGE